MLFLFDLEKNIEILEDFNPIVKFPIKLFKTKDLILSNLLKFLWNGQSYRDFGGNLAEL